MTSLLTWTAEELLSKKINAQGICWRLVEAQNKVSTLKLVDTLAEQTLLEEIIEKTKPPFPPELAHYHYLLQAPYKYKPYKTGSRFRRQDQEQGVLYASERVETAVAETAFYKALFFEESPDTPVPVNSSEHTAFSINYKTDNGLDLTKPPFDVNESRWGDLINYEACQKMADTCREASIELIRSFSVRCLYRGVNISLISWKALQSKKPESLQTWKLTMKKDEIIAVCEFPKKEISFPRSHFEKDPRISKKKAKK